MTPIACTDAREKSIANGKHATRIQQTRNNLVQNAKLSILKSIENDEPINFILPTDEFDNVKIGPNFNGFEKKYDMCIRKLSRK